MKKKKCPKCGETKNIIDFPKHNKCKNGYRHLCKNCLYEQRKLWYKKNKEKQKTYQKEWRLKRFGLTLEKYNDILKEQNYTCAICNKTVDREKKDLAVDHDHKFQKEHGKILIRGLLCSYCNRYVMGVMRDNKQIFRGVIQYLTKALKEYNLILKENKNE